MSCTLLSRRTGNNKEEGEQSDVGVGVGVYPSLKSLSKSLAISISDVLSLHIRIATSICVVSPIDFCGEHFLLFIDELWFCFRAEFMKYVVTPKLGNSGVGSAMAVCGAFDGIESMRL